MARARRSALWPPVAAMAVTYGSFAGVLLSLRYVARAPSASPRLPTAERIVLVVPRPLAGLTNDEPVARSEGPVAVARAPRVARPVPPDIGRARESSIASATKATTNPGAATEVALSPDQVSRLARPRPDVGAWIAVPTRDPFTSPTVPTAVERDAVLTALSTMVPDLAARRVPTRAERDWAAKEATLKMRLASRPLLVPPDNSGGLITARVPLLGGSSRKQRARDARSYDEGRARLRRLVARADSLRRAREDSLRDQRLAAP